MACHCFTDVGIWASLGKAGITTLEEIAGLHNYAVENKGQLMSIRGISLSKYGVVIVTSLIG